MSTMRNILDGKGYTFWFVSPYDTLKVALRRLAEHKAGALLVMDGERLYGILSERDVVRLAAQGEPLDLDQEVQKVMTTSVVGVALETSLDECMALMTTRRFRHVPVMKDKMVVGVVSMGDVVKAQLADRESILKGFEVMMANHELPT